MLKLIKATQGHLFMNKIIKHQKGFSIIETILVLVVIGLISVIGYLIVGKHATSTKLTSSTKAPSVSVTSNKASSTIVIPIHQLGLSLTLPTSLGGLTYSFYRTTLSSTNTTPILGAYLSTTNLTVLDNQCRASQGMALGAISVVQGNYPTNQSQQYQVGNLVKKYPNFFVAYNKNAQTSCMAGQNPAVVRLLPKEKAALIKALSNPNSIHILN